MTYFMAFLILGLCFASMALGLIFARKVLKKGCSSDPSSCSCQREKENAGKDDSSKDHSKKSSCRH